MRTIGALLCGLALGGPARADESIPKANDVPEGALRAIAEVEQAARTRDFKRLRKWMVDDFEYSLGDGLSADKAIERWRSDRAALDELAADLRRGCEARGRFVICPKGLPSDTLERTAGFKRTRQGWRMVGFSGGD
jgi:hypothetical protein